MNHFKNLIFIPAICFLLPNHIFAKGKVVHLTGNVKVDGKTAKKGSFVPEKGKIETDAGALVIVKFDGGSTVKVNENSSLILKKDEEKTQKTSLSLVKGSSFFKKMVVGKKSGGLTIKARNVAMGVRGTEFFVGFGKKKAEDVYMCVREGKVVIKGEDQKKATLVNAGEGVVVPNGKKSSKPKPLPWTKNLNWNLDPELAEKSKEGLENKATIEESYEDPLERDYD